jgi:hypothetical protein
MAKKKDEVGSLLVLGAGAVAVLVVLRMLLAADAPRVVGTTPPPGQP